MARGIVASFLGMFVLACSGCGGGGSSGPSGEPPSPIAVSMYGDSTYVGYTYPNGPGTQWIILTNNAPYEMQQTLQQTGLPVTVTNTSQSGAELTDLFRGAHGFSQTWAQFLTTDKSRIVMTNLGLGDVVDGDETPEQYGQLLGLWVDSARAAGKIPVLEEPNPSCDVRFANLPAYVAQMDLVSQQKGTPLVQQYAYIQSLPNWQSLLSDCLHPTAPLYAIKGQREAAVIGPIIKTLQ